jgi:hypothetical protein
MDKQGINIRIPAEHKQALEKEAGLQSRSLSNLVALILKEWLERQK